MITAIIIDDEKRALKTLTDKVEKYLPFIKIIFTTRYPQEGIEKIKELKPDLLFLDIDMPQMSGFDLLMKIGTPNFEIIFVTAHNNYAIEAIKHCAIGYIVKPIDTDELTAAVENAKKNIDQKSALDKNIQLLRRVNKGDDLIIIPTQIGMSFINSQDIIRVEGVDGYSKIFIKDEKAIFTSYNIGKVKELLKGYNFF